MIRDPPITDLNLRSQVFDQHRADFNSVLFYHKRFTPSSSSVSVVVFRSGFPGSFSLHLRRSERTDGAGERQQAQEGESLCSTWLQKVRSLSSSSSFEEFAAFLDWTLFVRSTWTSTCACGENFQNFSLYSTQGNKVLIKVWRGGGGGGGCVLSVLCLCTEKQITANLQLNFSNFKYEKYF